ncbi:sensor histidine kinase [Paraherbaspirillum soli]|uniref:histidine kinase n=1 Tax=Paraherbaspirillum soli TaxID=631222 RepID=A0ABW0MFM7_9BURK
MDGVKKYLNSSLQVRLSLWLSMAIVTVALGAGAFSFVFAFKDANELQDNQLRQIAALIVQNNLPLGSHILETSEHDPESDARVIVQVLPSQDRVSAMSAKRSLKLPDDVKEGMQTLTVRDKSWRLFVKELRAGNRLAVAQRTEVRDEIARDSGLRTLAPFVVLIPLLSLLVILLVRQMLKPVARLSAAMDQRSENDLSPLDDAHVPAEIRPLTASINRLLQRVAQAVEMQRRFVADAAHELRSPLTALSLQAENLERTGLPPAALPRLASMRQGLQRTRLLLDQLLSMARSQTEPSVENKEISVLAVFRRVLEQLMPVAEAKGIDLGVVSEQDVCLPAQEIDLTTLVKNLLDNAIRYTPAGGRIDLRVGRQQGWVELEVADSGPGIPVQERDRIFDPFYRILGNDEIGSGLGLAIVKAIVDRMGGTIVLADANLDPAARGLRVTVRLK